MLAWVLLILITKELTLAEADSNGSHIKMNNSRTGGGYWVINGVGDDGSSASIVPPGGILFGIMELLEWSLILQEVRNWNDFAFA